VPSPLSVVWAMRVLTGAAVVALVAGAAGGQPSRPSMLPIEVIHDGNRLEALRDAPVPCHTLVGFLEMLERPLPNGAFALRVVRSSPPGAHEFALCVTADGTLVVGTQRFAVDPRGRRGGFLRGEIERSFPALEGSGPWRWVVPIMLSREVEVTLEVTAQEDTWPVRRVVIRPEHER